MTRFYLTIQDFPFPGLSEEFGIFSYELYWLRGSTSLGVGSSGPMAFGVVKRTDVFTPLFLEARNISRIYPLATLIIRTFGDGENIQKNQLYDFSNATISDVVTNGSGGLYEKKLFIRFEAEKLRYFSGLVESVKYQGK